MDIELHLLDIHVNDGKLYILSGAVNTMHTPQMHYGICK